MLEKLSWSFLGLIMLLAAVVLAGIVGDIFQTTGPVVQGNPAVSAVFLWIACFLGLLIIPFVIVGMAVLLGWKP